VKILLHRAQDKKLKLSCTVDGNIPDQVRGDREKITQVLVSLLGNAIKFTDAGEVKLELQMCQNAENPRLKISVTDTGVGIPGDKLDRIFEYFTQADASATRRFGGTGLGLALAKKLVEKMGGHLKVDSREGLGSLFSFELSNAFELRSGALPAEEKKSPAGKKRVLLADDAEDNRMLFEAYVKDMDVELDTAENGREAVEKIKGKAYDVIFMDLEMPVMDGYEATRLVREWERGLGKRHRIIALTAHTQQQEHDKSLKSGCDECLVKPIERVKLSKILQTEPAKPKRDPATPATMSGESASKKPIRVVIDSDLESLIPRYVENRFKDVEIIRKALDAGDFETIRTSGHKMKGSGGGYGFDEISRLGQLIEAAGQDGDAPALAQSLELLRDYLERLDIRFERP
jgi:CheY-like chemotaxis protein/anti-sigma regulatory factor (Ser/Thr protein kinase)